VEKEGAKERMKRSKPLCLLSAACFFLFLYLLYLLGVLYPLRRAGSAHPCGILLRDPFGGDLSSCREKLDTTVACDIAVVPESALIPASEREWLSWHSYTNTKVETTELEV
jgi:hypothetical protein